MNDSVLSGLGFLVMIIYGLRLNDIKVGNHLNRCIAIQALGFVSSGWVFGSTPYIHEPYQWINFGLVMGMLGHLGITTIHWVDGAPTEYETKPAPLDGLQRGHG